MTRKRPFAASAPPILAFALLFAAGVSLAETVPQPIAFSHKLHVSDY
jgi:hypothetical protein